MKAFIATASLAALSLGLAAMPAAAQDRQITVTAPANLSADDARDWQRLERQSERLVERIADRERTVGQEQGEVADAQERLSRAQDKLREEERELERANDRYAEAVRELERVEQRMLAMGGQRVESMALAPGSD